MTADTILSVRQAVAYQDEHYAVPGYGHLVSERTVMRWLNAGILPCTRTADGRLGVTVRDLRATWERADRKAS